MTDDSLKITQDLINRDFELTETSEELVTEEELLQMLAERIGFLIENRMEFLLSLMYRLDVDEGKVHLALSPFAEEPPAMGLARLVLARQKQRAHTKQAYKPADLGDLDDWN